MAVSIIISKYTYDYVLIHCNYWINVRLFFLLDCKMNIDRLKHPSSVRKILCRKMKLKPWIINDLLYI